MRMSSIMRWRSGLIPWLEWVMALLLLKNEAECLVPNMETEPVSSHLPPEFNRSPTTARAVSSTAAKQSSSLRAVASAVGRVSPIGGWRRLILPSLERRIVMEATVSSNVPRLPWNKDKLTGQKPPLKLKEIWAIRIRLQLGAKTRDLAMFNLAVDSKLRACDLTKLRVRDVCLAHA
jgi:hypothetical protein